MSRLTSIFAFLLLGIAFASDAREAAVVQDEARNELAGEMAECSAYYSIAAEVATDASESPDKRASASKAALKAADATLQASAQLTTTNVAMTRADVARQAMLKEMGESRSFATLMSKHMLSCIELIEHADRRFAHWLGEKAKLPDNAAGGLPR